MKKTFHMPTIHWRFVLLTAIVFLLELYIALFVHDRFIRPWLGDVLVVILMYCFCRILVPARFRWLPVWLFLFATGIEILQYFHFVDRLGIQNRVLRVALGSTFDPADILCYLAGCLILLLAQHLAARRLARTSSSH